jgi:two-component system KDP operon response regulator KdpE
VLVVTDDVAIPRSLCQALKHQGFRTVEASSSLDLDELVTRHHPMVIVLDLDHAPPQVLTSITRLRERSDVPVIVLSTRGGEGDKITALDAGADDYVIKPFGTSELLARIRVASRHARSRSAADEVVQVGPIRIDHARHWVTVDGRPVHLTPIEYRLLALLARHAGDVLSRAQLLHGVWGPEANEAHYLRVHISALRHKIERDPAHPRWLVTVTGVGYRLCDG